MARSLRDILGLPKEWPDAGTPEFWEQFGCEGSNEYRDCHDMSADYARLRRVERRVTDVLDAWERQPCQMTGDAAAEILRRVMEEAKTDG